MYCRVRKPPRYINEIKITPQTLHYLDILFEEPLVLKVSRGVLAKVPAPSAFTLHKLLIASQFKRARKKEKDLRQAVYVGKYVLREKSQLSTLSRLWERLPRSGKTKVARALRESMKIVPLEHDVIKRLQDMLS